MNVFWSNFITMFGNIFSSFWNFLFSSQFSFYGVSFGALIIALIFFAILISFFFKG